MAVHDPTRTVILLAEDEVVIRNLVQAMLTDEGYGVLAAADGVEALEVCEQFADPIHLLVTNYNMPRMNGFSLAQQVRAVRVSIKVIVMSGAMDEAILEGNRPDAFLRKPFKPSALLTLIQTVLDGKTGTTTTT